MELMPALRLGLLNGWLLMVPLVLADGILFLVFPKEIVARLWDRSGWSQKQVAYTVLGKLFALITIALLVLTPLKLGSPVFIAGVALVALGVAGVVKALFDFRNTPLGQPVTRGVYRISRHPQIVSASLVILGATIAIGSWTALLALVAARALSHFSILAEEDVCLRQYGEPYRAYLERVPRYFVFF